MVDAYWLFLILQINNFFGRKAILVKSELFYSYIIAIIKVITNGQTEIAKSKHQNRLPFYIARSALAEVVAR